jgi:CBS domain-containing protein
MGHVEIELVQSCAPVCLPPTATVMMAARHMHSHHVSAVLITEADGTLVGIFTERDAISRVLAEGKDPLETTLAEVMTDNPDTVAPEDNTEQVVRRLRAAQCRHLPIVSDDAKALGMVSLGRLCTEPAINGPIQDAASAPALVGFGVADEFSV